MVNYKNSKTNKDENKYFKSNKNENEYPPEINGLIADLKLSIDILYEKFEKARSIIKELAKRLDESNLCKRDEISRKIKEILKDKIKERKITEKWIEDCLDPEYKRKYEKNKSEVTSLSKKGEPKEIMIANDESSVIEDNSDEESTKISDESKSNNITSPTKDSIKALQEGEIKIPLSLNEDKSREQQLEDALRSHSLVQSANKLNDVEYDIPKTNQSKIDEAFSICDKSIKVRFHGYNTLSSVRPDNAIKTQPEKDTPFSNNSANVNVRTNDSDTY